MRQKWKRLSAAAAVLLFLAVMSVMAGCSTAGGSEGDSEKVRLMVWSPSEDQSRGSGEWLQKCCAAFAEQHPEWDITFVYGIADEATAANSIAQDPEAGADVFMYANDNITTLTDSQAIAKFGGKYEKQIRENASEALLNSVTLDGFLYGVPFTTNTWFMYYDKSVFSEKDIKRLETMLQKGVVSFPFTNGWYLPSFYFGNGCTMFGDGTPRQMYAYSGSKAIGVNAHSEYMVPAVELAIYLGSAEAQRLHYELRSVIPCSTELQEDPVITSDPVFLAQNETFDRTSKLQPFVSRMANCWAPIENMGKSIRNGTVTHKNAAEQTKAMNKAMNSNGIQ